MTTERASKYDLSTLIRDCGQSGAVWVSRGALASAQDDFGLATGDKVREFIANNGLEQPRHISTVPWENNPDESQVVWVDSYEFFSGNLFGYFAFFKGATGSWVVKSFKKNDQPNPRFMQMKAALEKLKE
ncbi:MAG: hypothetical protein JRF33_02930 [Deltaproteobacteria bacterium]|nr:hypothetical protein [Deltaproteobacteria bacterium]